MRVQNSKDDLPISLVEHDVLDRSQVEVHLNHEMEQTSRGGDDAVKE